MRNKSDGPEHNQVDKEAARIQDFAEALVVSGQQSEAAGIGAFDEIGRHLINDTVND